MTENEAKYSPEDASKHSPVILTSSIWLRRVHEGKAVTLLVNVFFFLHFPDYYSSTWM